MPFYDPPIQQEDAKVSAAVGYDFPIDRIRPLKDRVFAKRLETWKHVGLIIFPGKMKTLYEGKVEIVAIGPNVKEAKVGEIALIGPYSDWEFSGYVMFQEADIRCIFDP